MCMSSTEMSSVRGESELHFAPPGADLRQQRVVKHEDVYMWVETWWMCSVAVLSQSTKLDFIWEVSLAEE